MSDELFAAVSDNADLVIPSTDAGRRLQTLGAAVTTAVGLWLVWVGWDRLGSPNTDSWVWVLLLVVASLAVLLIAATFVARLRDARRTQRRVTRLQESGIRCTGRVVMTEEVPNGDSSISVRTLALHLPGERDRQVKLRGHDDHPLSQEGEGFDVVVDPRDGAYVIVAWNRASRELFGG